MGTFSFESTFFMLSAERLMFLGQNITDNPVQALQYTVL